MRSVAGTRTGCQQERPDGAVRQVPETAAWPRQSSVAGRARAAGLRQRVRPGLEAVGRPDEDDPERIPPDALAERSAGADREADGGLLLRRKRGVAARLRAAADQVVGNRQ